MPDLGDRLDDILRTMIGAARGAAQDQWHKVGAAVTNEINVIGQRLQQIKAGLAAGHLTREDAIDHFAMVRAHAVAVVAMTTTLVLAAVQQIFNAALAAAKAAINAFIGFPLLLP